MAMLLSAQDVGKSIGPRRLFRGVSLSIEDGERAGMIGPNGSGKSTLLKMLAGVETIDEGTVTTRKGLRLAYVPQKDEFPAEATARGVVAARLVGIVHDEHEREIQADMALDRAGFADPEVRADSLSGGWRKRLAIVRELASEPDLLLLDEPTNHLDLEGILWLEGTLRRARFGVVVVTHDRFFLERAVTRVVELSRAYPQGTFSAEGGYSRFLERKTEFLGAQAREQQALAGKVREDIAWLSRGAKARRTKNKSRIEDAAERMDQLEDLRSRNAPDKAAGIDFAATGRRTRKLIDVVNVGKTLGGRTLFKGLELTLSPGMCLGLLGPNGSGKTTLIRVLSGELEPDPGAAIKRAGNLRIAVFSQARAELPGTLTLREALGPAGDTIWFQGRSMHIATWAQRFLFRTEQLRTPLRDLSGGEMARVLIARLMLEPADVLVLDEPTNDLDIASLEVLEESIESFPGAVVLVTHDRYMLQRVATDVLGLDGRGGARLFADYFQWEAAQGAAEPKAAEKRRAEAAPEPASAPGAATGRGRKLSYNEQREWDQIEGRITAAEAEVAAAEARMAAPDLATDRKKMDEACRVLGEAQAKVAALYARWEELEAKQR